MEDNVVGKKKEYKVIGLCVFDYKLFEDDKGGGVWRGHIWVLIRCQK